jgi:hypothetical protein
MGVAILLLPPQPPIPFPASGADDHAVLLFRASLRVICRVLLITIKTTRKTRFFLDEWHGRTLLSDDVDAVSDLARVGNDRT